MHGSYLFRYLVRLVQGPINFLTIAKLKPQPAAWEKETGMEPAKLVRARSLQRQPLNPELRVIMSKSSAGILLYRFHKNMLEVLLVHPGGPFWKNKDAGAWTIPKGEADEGESLFAAALREFREETGITASGNFLELEPVRQKSGKWVHGWALEMDIDADAVKSNYFEMEWPMKSGRLQSFPEIDKAAWYDLYDAKEKINPAQIRMLEQLAGLLGKK
jgi:predicted NUDIX family NTP pyrophosphohydrolase